MRAPVAPNDLATRTNTQGPEPPPKAGLTSSNWQTNRKLIIQPSARKDQQTPTGGSFDVFTKIWKENVNKFGKDIRSGLLMRKSSQQRAQVTLPNTSHEMNNTTLHRLNERSEEGQTENYKKMVLAGSGPFAVKLFN